MINIQITISVITCIYNMEKYLQEAIESVLNQTFPHWELLLIDDGSTDGSTSLAKHYAADHPDRIVYADHDGHVNKGLSASRNLGLKIARGELVTFLDADDVWQPNYLEAQFDLMQQKQVPIICEATEYWYNWNDSQKENQVIYIGTEQDKLYFPPQLMLTLYPLGTGAAPCMCGIILRQELLTQHGGFEEAFKGMYEDQAMLSKLYLNEPIYISSTCNNRYRQRSDSLVNSSHGAVYHLVRKQYLQWLKQYLQNRQLKYKEVEKLLQRATRPYRPSPLLFIMRKIPNGLKLFLKRHIPTQFRRFRKYRPKAK
jgi:glycosyltransferase involved in cell wall biosynthesis